MNAKPTMYLHIGAGKTGTTSIQTWLKQSQQQLHDSGYLIFDSNFTPNPIDGVMSNQQQFFQQLIRHADGGISAFQSQFRENLIYMREHNYHSAVISAEFILISLPQLTTWLEPFLHECEWKIIVYVRNQPQYLISSWKEWGYWQYSFDDMFRNASYLRANWYEMLQPWSEVFRKDQIYVGIFDSAYLNNQSIIHDFITAINLPELVDDSARHITTNPSLNNKSALLLSNIRQHNLNRESRAHTKPNPTDYVTEADYLEAMRMYTQHLRENFQLKSVLINRSRTTSTLEHDSPLSIATQSQLDYVYELFRESNQQLITEYRPDVTLDIAFPRIIATQHVDYSDIEIMYHGFHILLEATEEFMEQHKGYNKILQQQNEHIRTHNKRLKHHTQMLWKTVRAHTETFEQVQQQFAGVQEQLTQVQHQLAQLQEQIIQFNTATHQINSRTNTIKYWIIRIWHKFIRRST